MSDALDRRGDDRGASAIHRPSKAPSPLRYLGRLPAEPAAWLLMPMLVAAVGCPLYMVLSTTTY